MKLVILGGGGFRVPLAYRALVAAVGGVLSELATDISDAPAVAASTDLDEALRGAGFVF
jgi:6-phospho-beta-glucosidase